MDQMNQTAPSMSAPQPTPAPQPMPPKKGTEMGGIVAIVVIVALLALGGVYYLMTGGVPAAEETLPSLEEAQLSDDPAVQAALTQSNSDEISSIEADVAATDFGEIDAALSELDAQ